MRREEESWNEDGREREGKGREREGGGGGGGGVGGFHGMISRSFLCLLASSPTKYIICLCLTK